MTERLCGRIEEHDGPRLGDVRRCAVHNDPNDYNVLVARDNEPVPGSERVVGILDFGDMVHSFATADLAIAIAYAMLGSRDPLSAAGTVARGYNEVRALSDADVDTLFGLVTLRLCTSVAVAASQQVIRPEDPYLSISQEPIRAILPRLAGIHPRFATAALRAACGKPVLPSGRRVMAWLERPDCPTGSVLGCEVSHSTTIDLSVGSPLVTGDPRDNEELPLSARIEALMARREANVGIGRYGEARLLYSAPLFSSPQDRYGEHRTVHLGVDLFVPAGTAVLAPLDGVVHAVADNRAALDYGPVVILRHRTDAGDAFFTLYGHLRRASIVGLGPDRQSALVRPSRRSERRRKTAAGRRTSIFRSFSTCSIFQRTFPVSAEPQRWRSGVRSRRIPASCCGCRSEHSPSARRRGRRLYAQPERRICTNGAGTPSVET